MGFCIGLIIGVCIGAILISAISISRLNRAERREP